MQIVPIFPFIVAVYTAVLGVLGAGLTVSVIVKRVKHEVNAGDGGVPALAQAIRAHANFAEQVPLVLLLLALSESLGTPHTIVHVMGGALLFARLLSALGLSRSLGPTQPRQIGAGITVLVTVAAAVSIFYQSLAR